MTPDDLRFILSPAGQAALEALAAEPLTPDTHLATVAALRQHLSPEQAAAVLETALLRQRGARKFRRAGNMFFTRDGLEQATAEPLAAHRAQRYARAGAQVIADLGCGIGGDTLALAATGAAVIAIDREWLHTAITGANAEVYSLRERVMPVQADLMELSAPAVDAFFFDPARRTATGPRLAPGRRLHTTDDYRPPLRLIDDWRPVVPDGAAKVSPGIDYAELPAEAEIEFVSYEGEVREGVCWFGRLRTRAGRRATLLPGNHTLTDQQEAVTTCGPPRGYLYEPDGAVIRAHLVAQLAAQIGATLIDPHIAYLTAGAPASTPFARAYQIEDALPFQLKRLRRYLRERNVGQVTIKKRGSPLDPDALRQALRLHGPAHRVIFLTQVMGRPTVLIGQALSNGSEA